MNTGKNIKDLLSLAKDIKRTNYLAESSLPGEESGDRSVNEEDLYDFVNRADRLADLVLELYSIKKI